MDSLSANIFGIDRRTILLRLAALGLIPATGLTAACGGGSGMPMMGGASSSAGMPGAMMSDAMMDPAMMTDMNVIMQLLDGHQQIRRTVEDIGGGIRSITTSADTRLAGLIGSHVTAMNARLQAGRPIRHGDPLFLEIFKHHTDITMDVVAVPGGVQVSEISTNPQVTLLIRQHARAAVSAFVAHGMDAAMRPGPLPDGYQP